MPPMADLANEFSWSRSRDNTFQDCRRKYFYHYYGAWGGWEAGASPEVRRLYVLKQLASRQQWAGRIVHDAIEMALHILRAGRGVPVEPFIADAIERMRGEWRSSKAGRYHDSPKTLALFEHEYAVELNLPEPTVTAHRWDDERLEAVRDQLRLSIRSMKAYLADPAANLAVMDSFERTEELRICRWCNFKVVCRPELADR